MTELDTAPPLALVCSVHFECQALLETLADPVRERIGRRAVWNGRLGTVPVRVVEGGVGKVNVAQAVTALLEHGPVRGVLGFGIAGAYPGSGLAIGQVALASSVIYGDEGAETPTGWLGMRELGFALGEGFYNEIAAEPARVVRVSDALRAAGIAAAVGPFVTVSTCSGSALRGDEMVRRWPGALCEGMEGAAAAHVCALYGVPFLEMRGVSNQVEDRDPARWRVAEAAAAVQRALPHAAAAWLS